MRKFTAYPCLEYCNESGPLARVYWFVTIEDEQPFFHMQLNKAINRVLFGYDGESRNEATGKLESRWMKEIKKPNGADIPLAYFTNPRMENLSAILFSNTATFAKVHTSALRHVPASAADNRSFRQLLHVSFKIAAKMGDRYLDLLWQNEAVIAKNVTENLYERQGVPVFLGGQT